MASVLIEHMGDDFRRLSPLLQEVHDGTQIIEGHATVTRGNWLARLICTLFRFPAQNPQVKLRVECVHSADSMHWKRNFDGLEMESTFTRNGNYLVERLGPLAMSFIARERGGALHYDFVHTRFLGVPMPAFLSPQVIASEREVAGRYVFSVEVRMFLVGPVIAYGGELELLRDGDGDGAGVGA